MCGNTSLTPETKFDPSEGNAVIHFGDASVAQAFMSDPYRRFPVNRARVCLDCGHVALALGPRKLAALRAALAALRPLPE
jgi:hypothetical protein